MTETTFFTSTNNNYSVQTEGGGTQRQMRVGWCAAGSALWCRARLEGKAPGNCEPDLLRAGILQVKYRWDRSSVNWGDHVRLLQDAGVKSRLSCDDVDIVNCLRFMTRSAGVYHFSYWGRGEAHSMACDTRGANKYWYDIEAGCFGYDSAEEFREAITDEYRGSRFNWHVLACVGLV